MGATTPSAPIAVNLRHPRSPQPISAAAARRSAAVELAYSLVANDTPYALLPSDPSLLRALCVSSARQRGDAIKANTLRSDAWGFGWAMRFAQAHDTPWMRPRVGPPLIEEANEVAFTCLLLVWLCHQMRPCGRSRAAGLPLNAIYAYRRVLRDCQRCTPPMTLVPAQLKQQFLLFRRAWGELSLTPTRGRALSQKQQRAIVSALVANDLAWPTTERDSILTLKHYTMSTGTRLEELARVNAMDDALPRSHFTFHQGGRPLPPTPDGFRSVTDGCYLEVRSCSSKCDPDNMHWGAKSMWFVVDGKAEFNVPVVGGEQASDGSDRVADELGVAAA